MTLIQSNESVQATQVEDCHRNAERNRYPDLDDCRKMTYDLS